MEKSTIIVLIIIALSVFGYYLYRSKGNFSNYGFYDQAGLSSACITSGLKYSTCTGNYPYYTLKTMSYYNYPQQNTEKNLYYTYK